jgi:aspartyl-tRNA(Asn)/glutamyl-tRNA(Gln) amidotransferase subunit C
MSLNRSEVEKIAHLARLAVSEAEAESLSMDLSRILEFVAQMDSIETTGVVPMAHPLGMAQRLRPDEPNEPDRREAYQSIAPATEKGLYLVPKVIE